MLTRHLSRYRSIWVSIYLVSGAPDTLITIAMFDSADQAIESNLKWADWARNNVLELTKGLPEVLPDTDP